MFQDADNRSSIVRQMFDDVQKGSGGLYLEQLIDIIKENCKGTVPMFGKDLYFLHWKTEKPAGFQVLFDSR